MSRFARTARRPSVTEGGSADRAPRQRRHGLSVAALTVLMGVVACAPVDTGTTLVVEGTITSLYGFPAPGLSVASIGGERVTTDAQGRFVLEDVSTPYDLVIFDVASRHAQVVQGLVSDRPVVATALLQESTRREATLTFRFWDELAGDEIVVACIESDAVAAGCGVQQGTQEGTIDVVWYGPPVLTGVLRAVHYDLTADGLAVSYVVGTGDVVFALEASGAATANIFDRESIDDVAVEALVTLPTGMRQTGFGAWSATPAGAGHQVVPVPTQAEGGATVIVPVLESRTAGFVARGETDEGATMSSAWTVGLDAGDPTVEVTLPVAPVLFEPFDGASGVDPIQPFRVGVGADAVLVAEIGPVEAGAGPTIYVVTRSTEFTLPNLAAYDASLVPPASVAYEWHVDAIAPATADALSTDGGAWARIVEASSAGEFQLGGLVGTPTSDGSWARSRTVTFDFR